MDLFRNFILFRLFDLTFFPFCDEKRFRQLALPFVKTVGPEVFRGNFDCAGEQNYRSRLGVGFWRSYQSVPLNLAASLYVRKRSDVMTFSKKERRYPYLYQPLSEIRPLAVAGVGCYWRPERGRRNYVCIYSYPLPRTLMIAA